jgi:hypothetical protein
MTMDRLPECTRTEGGHGTVSETTHLWQVLVGPLVFCRALLDGFRVYVFLKSTCTDFVGGGLVQVVLEWHTPTRRSLPEGECRFQCTDGWKVCRSKSNSTPSRCVRTPSHIFTVRVQNWRKRRDEREWPNLGTQQQKKSDSIRGM